MLLQGETVDPFESQFVAGSTNRAKGCTQKMMNRSFDFDFCHEHVINRFHGGVSLWFTENNKHSSSKCVGASSPDKIYTTRVSYFYTM